MERVKLSDRPVASPPLAGPRTETIQLVPVEPAHGLLDMPFVQHEAPTRRSYSVKAKLFAGVVGSPEDRLKVGLHFRAFKVTVQRYKRTMIDVVRRCMPEDCRQDH